jgi:transposase
MDETGISDRPYVRRSWSRRGKTPIITSAGGWKNRTVIGTIVIDARGKPKLYALIRPRAVRSSDMIFYVKQLRRHFRNRKLILLWDGLPAHTSRETHNFLKTQKFWLTVERMPSYAPELNPPEYLWASLKTKNFANTCSSSLNDLDRRIRRGIRRLQRSTDVLRGCLRASGLFS